MLVVTNNTETVYWNLGDKVEPFNYTGEVIVAFDPSKSNMAMVVGTPTGEVLEIVEFSGNNRKKGPAMDTTLYCQQVRHYLKQYLSKVSLYIVATEQAITKKGASYHHSNMVLTEIRSNILNFFLEEFNMKVVEVNNWSWKFAILPEGFRSQYEKGSKKFFQTYAPDSPFTHYFEADATDCVCIYLYIVQTMCSGYSLYCNKVEQCTNSYKYYYLTERNQVTSDMKEVTFNPMFDIVDNINYYANRVRGNFFMLVDVNRLDLLTVYGKAVGFQLADISSPNVKVVVTPC